MTQLAFRLVLYKPLLHYAILFATGYDLPGNPTHHIWMLGQDPLASLFNALFTPLMSFFNVHDQVSICDKLGVGTLGGEKVEKLPLSEYFFFQYMIAYVSKRSSSLTLLLLWKSVDDSKKYDEINLTSYSADAFLLALRFVYILLLISLFYPRYL